ncbi:hypothetical protein, partial [Corynebacterium striatum]|uniref:hypothetical protein n=1 Tax=Corynebacterium striatum TaxID=43770 RepID=UPI003F7E744A
MLSGEHHIPNVGAGLPAIAVDQLTSLCLIQRYRSDAATRQASSHIDRVFWLKSGVVIDGAGADHGLAHRRDRRRHFSSVTRIAAITTPTTAAYAAGLILLLLLLALTLPATRLVGDVDVDLPHALLG